jgi:isocitrate lyase
MSTQPPFSKDTDSFAHERWTGVSRPYTEDHVRKLRGHLRIEYTIADYASRRLWKSMKEKPFVRSLGALTGGQAVQMVRAGLEAIYCSGWQVAADANTAAQTYPDQSLYPADSVPKLVTRINNALRRADQIDSVDGVQRRDYFVPIVADAEAGFGGALNAYELMKGMIEAGAAGVHFEDQLASEKKCGHLGGKVLVPTAQFERTLLAARLAADVCGVPTVLIARTDAESAKLLTSDIDERDRAFCTGERSAEGYYYVKQGLESCIARGNAYAKYADLLWMETSTPDLKVAQAFAEGVLKNHPNKMLAYNCSPSFNWKKNLDDATIAKFQKELGAMGYKFQFVTLAGFHMLNYASFMLSSEYNERGMAAYSELQQNEFAAEKAGYTGVKHQHEVGTGYFDVISEIVSQGQSSTTALKGSTEEAQFH